MSHIPSLLYRGDRDGKGVRSLRENLDLGLLTNLIKGGEGRIIFEQPLIDLINNHVKYGWDKTHFLSFSESKRTAFRFGIHCEDKEIDELIDSYDSYDAYDKSWDFAIIELDTTKLIINEIALGVYEGFFKPTLRRFKRISDKYRILLMNVKYILSNFNQDSQYEMSIQKAGSDEEWLVLPATDMVLNSGRIEFSAILDGGCLSNITRYKKG